MDQGKLNEKDIYSEFNLIVINGLNGLATPLDPVPIESYDWPERNGREYFFNGPLLFQDKQLDIDCVILGITIQSALASWNKFASETKREIIHDIYVYSHQKHYKVLFKKIGTKNWITATAGVGIRFTQEILLVPNDAELIKDVIIYDGNGNL